MAGNEIEKMYRRKKIAFFMAESRSSPIGTTGENKGHMLFFVSEEPSLCKLVPKGFSVIQTVKPCCVL